MRIGDRMVVMDCIIEDDDQILIEGYIDGDKDHRYTLVIDRKTFAIIFCTEKERYGYMRKISYWVERLLNEGKPLPEKDSLVWF